VGPVRLTGRTAKAPEGKGARAAFLKFKKRAIPAPKKPSEGLKKAVSGLRRTMAPGKFKKLFSKKVN